MKQLSLVASFIIGASFSAAPAFSHPVSKDALSFNWTGFYAGVNVGLVKQTMNLTDKQGVSFNATVVQVADPEFTGGLQAGYRRQMDTAWASGVYGLELSTNFSSTKYNGQIGSAFSTYQLQSQYKLNNTTLVQAIGGIAANNTLLFLAAGFSWTDISGSVINQVGVPFFNSFSVSKQSLGSAIGAGIEYSFTDNISARVKVDVVTPGVYTTTDNVGDSYQLSNSIVQGAFGVNYKFG